MRANKMKKKGVSPLVATMMMVLITLAAVGVIWGAIIPLIRTGLETAEQCRYATLTIDVERFTYFDAASGDVSVRVGAEPDIAKVNLTKIDVIVTGSEGSTKTFEQKVNLPGPNEYRVYKEQWGNATITPETAERVAVAAVIVIGGVEHVCRATPERNLPKI